jgi:hypothetical protein
LLGVSSSSRRGYNPDNVSLPPRHHELSLQDIANLPRGGDPATDLRDLERLPEARDSLEKGGKGEENHGKLENNEI